MTPAELAAGAPASASEASAHVLYPLQPLPKTETARELGLPGASWGQNYCLIALESRVLHGARLALSLISSW